MHKNLIKSVLESLPKPVEVAVVHIRGHQKGDTFEGRGNQLADKAAKEAALDLKEPIRILKLNENTDRKKGKKGRYLVKKS